MLEPDTISIVTYALGVLFTARSAFDFVSAAGVFTFSIEDENWYAPHGTKRVIHDFESSWHPSVLHLC